MGSGALVLVWSHPHVYVPFLFLFWPEARGLHPTESTRREPSPCKTAESRRGGLPDGPEAHPRAVRLSISFPEWGRGSKMEAWARSYGDSRDSPFSAVRQSLRGPR